MLIDQVDDESDNNAENNTVNGSNTGINVMLDIGEVEEGDGNISQDHQQIFEELK